MKNLIVLFFTLSIALVSCDDTRDYWYEINDKPILNIKKYNTGTYNNEIYDSLKLGFGNYLAQYQIIDTNETYINYQILQGDCNISINNNVNSISVESDSIGVHIIKFIATDILGKKGFAQLSLEVFNNLPPVCIFNIIQGSNYTITINASDSYDQDYKFGGKIINYKYTIDNYQTDAIPLNTINYQFTSAGSYRVQVSVQDNNGKWSEINSQTINII